MLTSLKCFSNYEERKGDQTCVHKFLVQSSTYKSAVYSCTGGMVMGWDGLKINDVGVQANKKLPK